MTDWNIGERSGFKCPKCNACSWSPSQHQNTLDCKLCGEQVTYKRVSEWAAKPKPGHPHDGL